jgi:hypothetical protein
MTPPDRRTEVEAPSLVEALDEELLKTVSGGQSPRGSVDESGPTYPGPPDPP